MTTLAPERRLTEFAECDAENICYTAHYTETEVAKDAGVYVRGFASTNSKDRHGQQIDPSLFTLKTFRENPQLWVNHKLYLDEFGNGHSVGAVDEIHAVKVANFDAARKRMDLIDTATGATVRTGVNTDGMIVHDGMKGLWVVCHVMEPSIVKDVLEQRLNAFSWSGVAYSMPNGKHAAYDLHEASLVNLPANAHALFQIGKSLYTETYDNETNVLVSTCIDLAAVSALLPASMEAQKAVGEEPKTKETKGGENMDDTNKEMLDGIVKALEGVSNTVKSVDEKLATFDGRLTEIENAAKKKPPFMTDEEAAAAKALTDAAEADAVAKAAAAAKAAETPALDANVAEVLKQIGELATVAKTVADSVTKQNARLEALEKQTATSKGASDDDAPAGDPTPELLAKAMQSLTPEAKRELDRKYTANLLIPQSAARRVNVGN